MFEFHFHGLQDGEGTFVHTGTTHDFLEVVCQIAQCYDNDVAGKFVTELLNKQHEKIPYLRLVDWNFDYSWAESRSRDGIAEGTRVPTEKRIELRKVA